MRKPGQVATDILSAPHQKMLKFGLVRLAAVYKGVLNQERIIKGAFSITGVHQYLGAKVSYFERILQFWRCKLSQDLLNRIVEVLPRLIKLFGKNGELLQKDFEAAGIEGTNKDHLCPARRRSVLLNHIQVIERDIARLAASAPKRRKVSSQVTASEEFIHVQSSGSSSSYFANITTSNNK
jgi:hypothetical protein